MGRMGTQDRRGFFFLASPTKFVVLGVWNLITGQTNWTSQRLQGKGFIVRDLCIENTSGPRKEQEQVVALLSESDQSVLYQCALHGYEDTLWASSSKQFYHDCTITGTVDFIFGDAVAVFQDSSILARGGAMLSSVGAHAPTPKYKFSVNQQIFTIEIIGQAANPWTVHPPPFSSSFAPVYHLSWRRLYCSSGTPRIDAAWSINYSPQPRATKLVLHY